ncbi:MAG: ABC transporter permease [Thalassolituus sp.]|mgnify:FL=1|jgi:simple sugar transport system permease protein|uniref:ABC transporter permease n=1 Tax=Thalassolituus TaxID=187492 RepID=UPI0009492976|nr:ABC transporter permease [Thalassolituus oleivorans]APR68385.1 ABC transporter permease [Thalassolituus oleivorans]MBQ0726792.1 ABC transporter permease [Thalassolituus oleivorans]MCA6128457.1 ABC transporter permease [Thalassolituus oleivorans 4BN06-13]MDF1641146.1 ABC transporter permease [Thalassolituus oleivorans]
MDIDLITNILYATLRTGTPLILIALGEMVCEKSGVLNLGQEGMLLVGAVVGFIAAYVTGSYGLGVALAMIGGSAMALLFGWLSITLATNQIATGLALTIFGGGLSAFIGASYVGIGLEGIQSIYIPVLSDIPVIGRVLFQHDPLVYLSFVLFLAIYWVFRSTRLGLSIRAVGENPEAANAIGIPVQTIRYGAVLFGGAMTGMAGAYLSLVYTPMWTEGMSAGRGWIALALVVFASWKAERIMLGAWLFGFASILHLVLQGTRFEVHPNVMAMLPYVATILVLVWLSSDAAKTKMSAPRSIGQPFKPMV